MSRDDQANLFASEAKAVLDELVPLPQQRDLMNGRLGEAKEAVAYDYMAPWGYRVVVNQE